MLAFIVAAMVFMFGSFALCACLMAGRSDRLADQFEEMPAEEAAQRLAS